MKQFLKRSILIMAVMITSSCSFNDETTNMIIENVRSAFEEEGMELIVKEDKSETFNYPISKEAKYKFEGGTIYLFYGFNETKQIEGNIRATLAVTEFTYPPQVAYYDNFAIIFMPNTDRNKISEKVYLVLERLKK
ncbi:hypothetical protein J2Z40_002150 [Cytobacillus eiseniae]|uniref:Lipoprotein n=1 Tax=Cytobacillus eiseniae TaxID=762947 RepID=A0ABS4RFA1_9BACI|nr:hypothetical protein [Cytobacillus eiseniae]MBP2241587.1 hypothetical protein [Cytobacillus eiseniae]